MKGKKEKKEREKNNENNFWSSIYREQWLAWEKMEKMKVDRYIATDTKKIRLLHELT